MSGQRLNNRIEESEHKVLQTTVITRVWQRDKRDSAKFTEIRGKKSWLSQGSKSCNSKGSFKPLPISNQNGKIKGKQAVTVHRNSAAEVK